MNRPLLWLMLGPGLLIPVFFLSLNPVFGQGTFQEASVASGGGCYVSRTGFANAGANQAGLGWIIQASVSIHHSRPFLTRNLGISSLSLQVPAGEGAFGVSVSSFGIKGLHRSSAWVSYGIKLLPGVTAGIGIHGWTSSIPERIIYHPGIACALGIQVRINKQFILGGHVQYPGGWSSDYPGMHLPRMRITAGASYTFFSAATFHTDLHILPEEHIRISHGIELALKDRFAFLLGMHNHPYSGSFGIHYSLQKWIIEIAFEYMVDTGTTPSTSLSHVW